MNKELLEKGLRAFYLKTHCMSLSEAEKALEASLEAIQKTHHIIPKDELDNLEFRIKHIPSGIVGRRGSAPKELAFYIRKIEDKIKPVLENIDSLITRKGSE